MKWIGTMLLVGILLISLTTGSVAAVDIFGGEYEVEWDTEDESYNIDGDGEKQITLTRGVTYEFHVDSQGEPFHLTDNATLTNNYQNVYREGISVENRSGGEDATETGVLEITVDEDAPDELYYTSANTQTGSVIHIVDSEPAGEVSESPLPILIGHIGGIPYWLLSLTMVATLVVGVLIGRDSHEWEMLG